MSLFVFLFYDSKTIVGYYVFYYIFFSRIRIHYFFVVNFQERRFEDEMKILSLLYQPKQIHERTEHQTVVLGKRFNALVEKLKIIQKDIILMSV